MLEGSGNQSINRRLLRKRIDLILRSDADLDAFCIDHYFDIHSRFSDSMDRTKKVNLLLQLVPNLDQLDKLLISLEEKSQQSVTIQDPEIHAPRGRLPSYRSMVIAGTLFAALGTGLYSAKHLIWISKEARESAASTVRAVAASEDRPLSTLAKTDDLPVRQPRDALSGPGKSDEPMLDAAKLHRQATDAAPSNKSRYRLSSGTYDTEKVEIVSNNCLDTINPLQLDGPREVVIDGDLVTISSRDKTVPLGSGFIHQSGGFANLSFEAHLSTGECTYFSERRSKLTITGNDRLTLRYYEERSQFQHNAGHTCKSEFPCRMELIYFMQK